MDPVKSGLRWLPAILLASLLFVLSSQPELRLVAEPVLDTVLRKLGHLAAYALLAILIAYPLGGVGRARRVGLALVLVVAYGLSDEIHQAFVPGRVPALSDVAIDAAGGVIGLVGARLVGPRRGGREQHDAGVGRFTGGG